MSQKRDGEEAGLIVLSHLPYGGIADYLHHQANALVESGVRVLMVGVRGAERRNDAKYECFPLWVPSRPTHNRLSSRLRYCRSLIANMHRFADFIESRPERNVMIGGFFEYLAPLWAGRFRRLAKEKKRFFTIVHDPVRDFVVGPRWWHRYSIRHAYSFIDTGFVHGPVDAVELAEGVTLVTIPMGNFPFAQPAKNGHEMRQQLGIPDTAKAVLAFGHLRDSKNLGFLLRALVVFPDVHLIIAGKEQSAGQRPASYYRKLAYDLGISDRCHFEIRYIADDEVGSFFTAADLVALTYSDEFRSASSVLAACAAYRVRCLASSGPGPLKDIVQTFNLGAWVEPNCVDAICEGLRNAFSCHQAPRWEEYDQEYSWKHNANVVKSAIMSDSFNQGLGTNAKAYDG